MARRDAAMDRAFGQVLRERRRTLGLTQEALASQCGVHPTYISLLERGRSSPTLAVVALVARELGLTAAEMVSSAEAQL